MYHGEPANYTDLERQAGKKQWITDGKGQTNGHIDIEIDMDIHPYKHTHMCECLYMYIQ